MSDTILNEDTPTKQVQPKCGNCNHASSFHGGGHTRCFVVGCHCEGWVEPAEDPTPA